ncbi:formate hydrogenlyase [Malaciobacter molluscorum LMG 25693]|uniref:Formate hydrogenlyase n=1 Tax=Malaciobacter molluscorum LMG 25693 TaxID=870501 RepID=A0A2G1DL21_9BACT|nr:formate hydrogenlyase complex iron-sulfur subunit [Malaciobacter molluscorum]AXX91990.1 hydrogenase-4, iron-sulfur protein [Malaciobacter molluscorum LMG 25693]PHO19223.1 formate hydrogenlyase [Malaciobacter molluscorum LMG 25693]
MKLLDMANKYGKATYNYPFQPYVVAENFRGKPSYIYENCIGCTACGVACPSNAINVKLNEDKTKLVWEFDAARCIFCGRCDEVCPTGAVVLSQEFELAVKFDKNNLKEKGELDVEYCEVCNKPFTTKRLISYNLHRLEKAGWNKETLDKKVHYIRTCPDCKRKHKVEVITQYLKRGTK